MLTEVLCVHSAKQRKHFLILRFIQMPLWPVWLNSSSLKLDFWFGYERESTSTLHTFDSLFQAEDYAALY